MPKIHIPKSAETMARERREANVKQAWTRGNPGLKDIQELLIDVYDELQETRKKIEEARANL